MHSPLRVVSRLEAWSSLLLIVACGCGSKSSETAPAPEMVAVGPTVPEDRSLSLDKYAKAGVPSPDSPWSASDMTSADKALTTIARKSPQSLPRYQSERSGSLFARITSAENLELLKDHSQPIGKRLDRSAEFAQACDSVFNLYAFCSLRGAVGDSELVELMGLHLRNAVVMIELANEYLPTAKKDDPEYRARMARFERMKQGLPTTVAGALKMFTDKAIYRPTELTRLVGYLQNTLPAIIVELAPGARAKVLAEVEKLAANPTLSELKPGLEKLYEQVRAAAERAERIPSEQESRPQ